MVPFQLGIIRIVQNVYNQRNFYNQSNVVKDCAQDFFVSLARLVNTSHNILYLSYLLFIS